MLNAITMLLCLLIFVRLFSYQRGGARFRRGVSVAAVVVMGCTGAMVINILGGEVHVHADLWPIIGLLAVFAVGLLNARGNLARLLLIDHWDGRDRRHR